MENDHIQHKSRIWHSTFNSNSTDRGGNSLSPISADKKEIEIKSFVQTQQPKILLGIPRFKSQIPIPTPVLIKNKHILGRNSASYKRKTQRSRIPTVTKDVNNKSKYHCLHTKLPKVIDSNKISKPISKGLPFCSIITDPSPPLINPVFNDFISEPPNSINDIESTSRTSFLTMIPPGNIASDLMTFSDNTIHLEPSRKSICPLAIGEARICNGANYDFQSTFFPIVASRSTTSDGPKNFCSSDDLKSRRHCLIPLKPKRPSICDAISASANDLQFEERINLETSEFPVCISSQELTIPRHTTYLQTIVNSRRPLDPNNNNILCFALPSECVNDIQFKAEERSEVSCTEMSANLMTFSSSNNFKPTSHSVTPLITKIKICDRISASVNDLRLDFATCVQSSLVSECPPFPTKTPDLKSSSVSPRSEESKIKFGIAISSSVSNLQVETAEGYDIPCTNIRSDILPVSSSHNLNHSVTSVTANAKICARNSDSIIDFKLECAGYSKNLMILGCPTNQQDLESTVVSPNSIKTETIPYIIPSDIIKDLEFEAKNDDGSTKIMDDVVIASFSKNTKHRYDSAASLATDTKTSDSTPASAIDLKLEDSSCFKTPLILRASKETTTISPRSIENSTVLYDYVSSSVNNIELSTNDSTPMEFGTAVSDLIMFPSSSKDLNEENHYLGSSHESKLTISDLISISTSNLKWEPKNFTTSPAADNITSSINNFSVCADDSKQISQLSIALSPKNKLGDIIAPSANELKSTICPLIPFTTTNIPEESSDVNKNFLETTWSSPTPTCAEVIVCSATMKKSKGKRHLLSKQKMQALLSNVISTSANNDLTVGPSKRSKIRQPPITCMYPACPANAVRRITSEILHPNNDSKLKQMSQSRIPVPSQAILSCTVSTSKNVYEFKPRSPIQTNTPSEAMISDKVSLLDTTKNLKPIPLFPTTTTVSEELLAMNWKKLTKSPSNSSLTKFSEIVTSETIFVLNPKDHLESNSYSVVQPKSASTLTAHVSASLNKLRLEPSSGCPVIAPHKTARIKNIEEIQTSKNEGKFKFKNFSSSPALAGSSTSNIVTYLNSENYLKSTINSQTPMKLINKSHCSVSKSENIFKTKSDNCFSTKSISKILQPNSISKIQMHSKDWKSKTPKSDVLSFLSPVQSLNHRWSSVVSLENLPVLSDAKSFTKGSSGTPSNNLSRIETIHETMETSGKINEVQTSKEHKKNNSKFCTAIPVPINKMKFKNPVPLSSAEERFKNSITTRSAKATFKNCNKFNTKRPILTVPHATLWQPLPTLHGRFKARNSHFSTIRKTLRTLPSRIPISVRAPKTSSRSTATNKSKNILILRNQETSRLCLPHKTSREVNEIFKVYTPLDFHTNGTGVECENWLFSDAERERRFCSQKSFEDITESPRSTKNIVPAIEEDVEGILSNTYHSISPRKDFEDETLIEVNSSESCIISEIDECENILKLCEDNFLRIRLLLDDVEYYNKYKEASKDINGILKTAREERDEFADGDSSSEFQSAQSEDSGDSKEKTHRKKYRHKVSKNHKCPPFHRWTKKNSGRAPWVEKVVKNQKFSKLSHAENAFPYGTLSSELEIEKIMTKVEYLRLCLAAREGLMIDVEYYIQEAEAIFYQRHTELLLKTKGTQEYIEKEKSITDAYQNFIYWFNRFLDKGIQDINQLEELKPFTIDSPVANYIHRTTTFVNGVDQTGIFIRLPDAETVQPNMSAKEKPYILSELRICFSEDQFEDSSSPEIKKLINCEVSK